MVSSETRVRGQSGVRRCVLIALVAGCALLTGVTFPLPTNAKDTGPLQFSKADRHVIRAQLQYSIMYALRAHQVLHNAVGPEGLESSLALAAESYKLQRFAVAGVRAIMNDSPRSHFYANPGLAKAVNAIEQAMHHTRQVRAIIKAGIRWESERRDTSKALQGLEETVSLIRQAAALI